MISNESWLSGVFVFLAASAAAACGEPPLDIPGARTATPHGEQVLVLADAGLVVVEPAPAASAHVGHQVVATLPLPGVPRHVVARDGRAWVTTVVRDGADDLTGRTLAVEVDLAARRVGRTLAVEGEVVAIAGDGDLLVARGQVRRVRPDTGEVRVAEGALEGSLGHTVDARDGRVFLPTQYAGALHVIDPAGPTIERTISTEEWLGGVSVVGRRAFLLGVSGGLTAVDLDTGAPVALPALGDRAGSVIAIGRSGDRLFVLVPGALLELTADGRQRGPELAVPMDTPAGHCQIVVVRDGQACVLVAGGLMWVPVLPEGWQGPG